MSQASAAVRSLRRTPWLTAAVIAAMCFAMAADFCAVDLLDALLLRPLPVADPAALVELSWRALKTPAGITVSAQPGMDPATLFSLPEFRRLETASRGNAGLFAFAPTEALADRTTVAAGRDTFFTSSTVVSGSYFPDLGLVPAAGRLIATGDDKVGSAPVAVLSYRTWRDQFFGRADVVGSTATIDGSAYTIIGVAPKGFGGLRLGFRTGIWLPIATWPGMHGMKRMFAPPTAANVWWLAVFGRLRPGVGRAAAASALGAAYRNSIRSGSGVEGSGAPTLALASGRRGAAAFQDSAAEPLWPVAAAALLALLIACGSVGALLWARGMERQTELAVRLALGARRSDLVMQCFLEALFLCATAFVIAFAVAVPLASKLGPDLGAAREQFGFSSAGNAMGPAYVIYSLVTLVIVAGLASLPAVLSCLRQEPAAVLARCGGLAATAPRHRYLGPRTLLVAQICLSFLVVTAGVLFSLKLWTALQVSPGFKPDNLLTFNIAPGSQGYNRPRARRSLYDGLLAHLDALPGVVSASASSVPPVPNQVFSLAVRRAAGGKTSYCWVYVVGPDFLKTAGVALREGADPTWQDERAGREALVVNAAAARALSDVGGPLVGSRVYVGQPWRASNVFVVAGVIGAFPPGYIGQHPTAFVLYNNNLALALASQMTLEIRTRGRPLALMPSVRAIVRTVAPGLAIREVTTAADQLAALNASARFAALFAGGLSVLALLLAAFSIFGTQAYFVAARRRELGIRLVLGAGTRRVVVPVLRQSVLDGCIGLAAGLGLAYLGERWMAGAVGSLPKLTPGAEAGACALLLGCVLLGAIIPALRAASIEPVAALRPE